MTHTDAVHAARTLSLEHAVVEWRLSTELSSRPLTDTGVRCAVRVVCVQHEGYCSPLDGVEEYKLPLERCSQLCVRPSV
jgi:hypothetical protein